MSSKIPDGLEDLLHLPIVGVLATVTPDGSRTSRPCASHGTVHICG